MTAYLCNCGHLSVEHTYCKYECHAPACDCKGYETTT